MPKAQLTQLTRMVLGFNLLVVRFERKYKVRRYSIHANRKSSTRELFVQTINENGIDGIFYGEATIRQTNNINYTEVSVKVKTLLSYE